MITIPTHEAKTHLSKYLDRARQGETIVILRGKCPIAKLVSLNDTPQEKIPKVGQTMDERMVIPQAVFEPLAGHELAEWGL